MEVGDLGYFSVSVASKLIDKRNEIRAEPITFSRLNFKPTARVLGLKRDTAIHDLNAFIEEGWLCKYGTARTVIYLLTK